MAIVNAQVKHIVRQFGPIVATELSGQLIGSLDYAAS